MDYKPRRISIKMNHWINDAVFYHIYPLGLCGAPARNDFSSTPLPRLEQIEAWLDHIQELGANTLYLGPLFESSAHGYDTADYYWVDRRLGTNETLAHLSQVIHQRGMRLILDGVFNHVGRHFWAFRDLQSKLADSTYKDWFHGLRFDGTSPHNDPFTYEGWNGHYDLVKLDLGNVHVREHLFGAIETWVREFEIDGLRLDAADCLDMDFLRALTAFCRSLRPDFWLMGEIIHGDYRRWANPEMLDSVTNYECYKGLYSSHVDKNYFEISYALNRQFGRRGLYQDLMLYNFCDNHDVNRVASNLANLEHLYPLHILLLCMPGVPSIYYGSEWGIEGKKSNGSDAALRPNINLQEMNSKGQHKDLPRAISRLTALRHQSDALRHGDYTQILVSHQQLAFLRQADGDQIVVVVNAESKPAAVQLRLPAGCGSGMIDLLNGDERFESQAGTFTITIPACWGRVLRVLPAG
jgi:cyclomaltodextrinase